MFTGKERDAAETGYDYFGARYYDPWSGRWMSVDPISAKYNAWSPYHYAADNPLRIVDPDGMDWKDALKGFAFGFGKGVVGLATSPISTLKLVASYASDPFGTSTSLGFAMQNALKDKYEALTNLSPANDFDRSAIIGEITFGVASTIAGFGSTKTTAGGEISVSNAEVGALNEVSAATGTVSKVARTFKGDDLFQVFTIGKDGKPVVIGDIAYKDVPMNAWIQDALGKGYKGAIFKETMEVHGGAIGDIMEVQKIPAQQ
jgi:RHS repeat-associated protein